jgi:uncharacterized protein (DUF305 family)
MTKMLSEWFGKTPPPVDPFPDWVGTLQGAEFESYFLKLMSEHHSEGIDLSVKCAEQAKHPELKGLCAKMTDEERAERKQMRDMACAWFQTCS